MSQTETGCSFHRPSFLTRLRMYASGSSTQMWLVVPPQVWSTAGWFGLSWLSMRRYAVSHVGRPQVSITSSVPATRLSPASAA